MQNKPLRLGVLVLEKIETNAKTESFFQEACSAKEKTRIRQR